MVWTSNDMQELDFGCAVVDLYFAEFGPWMPPFSLGCKPKEFEFCIFVTGMETSTSSAHSCM